MEQQIALVGDTGFVGSNLCESYHFNYRVHSANVKDMYGLHPDILIYAGVTGTKWYANRYPIEDQKVIWAAYENIKRIDPRKLILISTIDIYDNNSGMNESSCLNMEKLHTYGRHRAELEKWVKENIRDYYIVRLPAIYGKSLKKNFIYDMIHLVPKILPLEWMEVVIENIPNTRYYYEMDKNKNYKLKSLDKKEYIELRNVFKRSKINALNFTNSESEFQFYNLKYLWGHLKNVVKYEIREINLVTEPLKAVDIYSSVYGGIYISNMVPDIHYNIKSLYSERLEGKRDYLYGKGFVIDDLKTYVTKEINYLTNLSHTL